MKPPSGFSVSFFEALSSIEWFGLRPELKIVPIQKTDQSDPYWVLEDPLSGKYFQLGYQEYLCVKHLAQEPNLLKAIESFIQAYGLQIDEQKTIAFIQHLIQEGLTQGSSSSNPSKVPWWAWPMKLFYFRIPLIYPDAFLRSTFSWVSPLGFPILWFIVLIFGLLGLTRVLENPEMYWKSAALLYSPSVAFATLIITVLIKIGHELAHAYTAKAKGVTVRSIGVAFMFGWPILFTDVSDAWKCPRREDRIWISSAGILFELGIACLALFCWGISPEGPLQGIFFFLSAFSLVSSLFINLNPFMKFDGYYMLMDYRESPNLMTRANAYFQYLSRRALLNWKGPTPEKKYLKFFTFYALGVKVYRILILMSIAIAVSWFFPESLKKLWFAFFIMFFLMLPFLLEMKSLARSRQYIGSKGSLAFRFGLFLLGVGLFLMPLPLYTSYPSVIKLANHTIYSSRGVGKLESQPLKVNQIVEQGELLFQFSNTILEKEKKLLSLNLNALNLKIQNLNTAGSEGAQRDSLIQERKRVESSLGRLKSQLEKLSIYAQRSGRIVHINEELYQGCMVGPRRVLCSIADSKGAEIEVFIEEKEFNEKSSFSEAYVVAEQVPLQRTEVQFQRIFPIPVRSLGNQVLLDRFGGPISSITQDGEDITLLDYRKVTFTFGEEISWPHLSPAWLQIKTDRRSLYDLSLGKWFDHAVRAIW